jgi:hypothetical protein
VVQCGVDVVPLSECDPALPLRLSSLTDCSTVFLSVPEGVRPKRHAARVGLSRTQRDRYQHIHHYEPSSLDEPMCVSMSTRVLSQHLDSLRYHLVASQRVIEVADVLEDLCDGLVQCAHKASLAKLEVQFRISRDACVAAKAARTAHAAAVDTQLQVISSQLSRAQKDTLSVRSSCIVIGFNSFCTTTRTGSWHPIPVIPPLGQHPGE